METSGSYNGATPLIFASKAGHEATARLLLDSNAAVDKAMEGGATPLIFACRNGHEATVRAPLVRVSCT